MQACCCHYRSCIQVHIEVDELDNCMSIRVLHLTVVACDGLACGASGLQRGRHAGILQAAALPALHAALQLLQRRNLCLTDATPLTLPALHRDRRIAPSHSWAAHVCGWRRLSRLHADAGGTSWLGC